MPNLFTKPVDLIATDDIRALIGQPEGQRLEFKGRLDFDRKTKSADSWLMEPASGKPRSGPDDYARESLFREICGFANSDGGWLILGIEETQTKPRTAAGFRFLPECINLAEQLERAAQDWFDPPLTAVRCRGIEMDGEPGEGVVVMHVPRSALAPHRLNKSGRTKESYRRAGEQNRPMGMREIQDMTLERSRGVARVHEAFAEGRNIYDSIFNNYNRPFFIGYSISMVPISGALVVDRPYCHGELFERCKLISVSQGDARLCDIPCFNANNSARELTPILRGGRAKWFDCSRGMGLKENESIHLIEVKENGNVRVILKQSYLNGIFIDWLLVDAATALLIADKVRINAGDSMASFAMSIEIKYYVNNELNHGVKGGIPVGMLGDEDARKTLPYNPMSFPIYTVDDPSSISYVLSNIINDFNNALGRPHQDGLMFHPISFG